MSRRSRYYLYVAGIVVASREEDETKFNRGAKEEADTCKNPMKLSYADTIVEDIERLVSEALAKNGNTGVVVRCRVCQENNVHVETQQQRIEAVESQQYRNTFWLHPNFSINYHNMKLTMREVSQKHISS